MTGEMYCIIAAIVAALTFVSVTAGVFESNAPGRNEDVIGFIVGTTALSGLSGIVWPVTLAIALTKTQRGIGRFFATGSTKGDK